MHRKPSKSTGRPPIAPTRHNLEGKLATVKRTILSKRGSRCDCCELAEGVQAAHIFIGKDTRKGKGYDKFLTVEENIALLCLTCHGQPGGDVWSKWYNYAKDYDWLITFMERQIRRYSENRMRNWLNAIPSGKQRGSGGEWAQANNILEHLSKIGT